MMPIEPVTLSFGAALLLGLSFGAGPCNIACLPYLGPVFTASGQGLGSAWRSLLPFSLGRLAGYTLLGAAAGWAGVLVQDWVASPWVRWLLGGATLAVALSILLRRQHTGCNSRAGRRGTRQVRLESRGKAPLPGGLFLMGLGMAFNPCAPLTTIILAAATTASLSAGLSLGIGFGLGAVLIPGLIFAIGIAHFSEQLQLHLGRWRGVLENASIGLLILMGIGTASGWITP